MLLSISNLNKTYKNGVKALNNINLEITTGMFGLLGPNGAGKSTMMRTVATLQDPDSGSIHLDDIDVLNDNHALRKVLGYLPQEFGVYPGVSATELLHYFASLKGISSKKDRNKIVDYVLEITNLSDVKRRHVSGYSGGMKQRFGIAQMLLNDPELIIVDEPTAGLDPAERKRFLNILREISQGHIVIFSTHIVEDVKELCTDMAIMYQGSILLRQSPNDASAELEGKIYTKRIEGKIEDAQIEYNVISSNYNPDNSMNVRVYSESSPGQGFTKTEPNLEDVYFYHLNSQGAVVED
ncbi:MAG: ABC transporter ATP-binding protein [Saprospiraceae bacterium]|nr:ABC transporter ATP-binding protein [Saprospiraceae bacterium]|tara:strand:- start:281 stop:1168 length:888 start_codon:yes stop_codon:yes gene_type:complete